MSAYSYRCKKFHPVCELCMLEIMNIHDVEKLFNNPNELL